MSGALNPNAGAFTPTFGPPATQNSPATNRKGKGKKGKGKNKNGSNGQSQQHDYSNRSGNGVAGRPRSGSNRGSNRNEAVFKTPVAPVATSGLTYTPSGAAYAPSARKVLKQNYSPTGALYGPAARAQTPVVLASPYLLASIMGQIDFYFGDTNFPKDKHLQKLTHKGKHRFIAVKEIASFKKMQILTPSLALVVKAMQVSQVVEVNKEGTHVRRREEKVEVKIDDAWRRTVVVVGHQLGASVDDTRKRFSAAGTVLHVRNVDLNRKPLAPDLRKYTAAVSQPHAAFQRGEQVILVEYKDTASALNACEKLTDRGSWRAGLKVTMLMNAAKKATRNNDWSNANLDRDGEDNSPKKEYSQKEQAATDANGNIIVLSRREKDRRRLLLECPELADTGAPKPGRRKLGLQKKGTVGFHSSHRRMPFGPQNAGEAGGPPENGFGKGRGKPLIPA